MQNTAIRRTTSLMVALAMLAVSLVLAQTPAIGAGPIYVDQSASGADNGTSWTDAFTDLQDALAVASSGDEVRIAQGVYTPHAVDRTVSFDLIGDVDLIGGYPPGGSSVSDPDSHPTVLSGDLLGNDFPFPLLGDNSLHVVRGDSSVTQPVLLNGIRVMAGNADGMGTAGYGGGIYLEGTADVELRRTLVFGNRARSGGGMYIDVPGTVELFASAVDTNVSTSGSWPTDIGGIYVTGGHLVVSSSSVDGNIGDGIGLSGDLGAGATTALVENVGATLGARDGNAALAIEEQWDELHAAADAAGLSAGVSAGAGATALTVDDSSISVNTSEGISSVGPVGYDLDQSEISFNGHSGLSTFLANAAPPFDIDATKIVHNGLHGLFLGDSTGTFVNGDLSENDGAGIRAIDSDPTVRDARIESNVGGGIDGSSSSFRVAGTRIAGNDESGLSTFSAGSLPVEIINSEIVDNHSSTSGGGLHIETSTVRVQDTLIAGNTAAVSGGGAFLNSSTVEMTNVTVADNNAATVGGILGDAVVENSVVWGNLPGGPGIVGSGPVSHSTVQNWPGGGTAVSSSDPLFAGPDNYRLQPTSPSREAGDNTLVDPDLLDVDNDGDTADIGPDLDGLTRIVGTVDQGAYETPVPSILPGGVVVSVEGDDEATIWELPVTLSEPSPTPVSIDWQTGNLTPGPGIAQAGDDFAADSGTITIAPGQTSTSIELKIYGDTLDEVPLLYGEWGIVTFSNPQMSTLDTSGFFGAGLFIIIDDD